jgi:succinate dehydrogenase / fumarate reductase cytochrome b subunit
MTSILTRITGNAMLITALLIVWWFLAAATSAEYFDTVNGIMTSWFGDLVFTLSLLGLWYHTLAGIRHMIWDTGRMLDVPTAEKLGWTALIGSVVLTILTIIIV